MGVILSPDGLNAVQNVEVLKWEQILEFIKFEQMMGAMGIGIHCGYCSQAFGPPVDGINMAINEADKTITLTCNQGTPIPYQVRRANEVCYECLSSRPTNRESDRRPGSSAQMAVQAFQSSTTGAALSTMSIIGHTSAGASTTPTKGTTWCHSVLSPGERLIRSFASVFSIGRSSAGFLLWPAGDGQGFVSSDRRAGTRVCILSSDG